MSSMLKVIVKHLDRCVEKEVVVHISHVVVEEEDMEVVVEEEDTPEVAAAAHGVEEVHLVRVLEAESEDEVHPDHEVLDVPHRPRPHPRVPETLLDRNQDRHATRHAHDPNLPDVHDPDHTKRRDLWQHEMTMCCLLRIVVPFRYC